MDELYRVNVDITVPARDKYEAVRRLTDALGAVPAIWGFDIPPEVARVMPQAELMAPVSHQYLPCQKGHNHLTRSGVRSCDEGRTPAEASRRTG